MAAYVTKRSGGHPFRVGAFSPSWWTLTVKTLGNTHVGLCSQYVAWFVMKEIGRISPYHRPFQGSWWPPCGWSSWSQPVKDWRLKILTFESKAPTRQQRRASNDQNSRDFHTMSRFVKDSIANKTPLNIHLCHYVTWAFHRTTFLRCCVVCGWAPDGRHFLGATTAPRRLEKPRIPSRACKTMRLTLVLLFYYTFDSLWVEAKLTGESSVDFLVNFSQYSNFHFSHLGRWLWCFQDACRQQDWTLRLPGLTIGKVGVWWTFTCRCEQKTKNNSRKMSRRKQNLRPYFFHWHILVCLNDGNPYFMV